MPNPFNNGLPRLSILLSKRRNGVELTESEKRQLEAYDAVQFMKSKPFNRGAYIKIITDGGVIEGSVMGSDEEGNYLIHYATNSQCVVQKSTILRSYLLRESTLIDLEQYMMGQEPKYERIVKNDGRILKFFDLALEEKRIKGEEIILPESERLRPGDNWGMWY